MEETAGVFEVASAAAWAALLARLEKQAVEHVGHWSRDELYEDDE